MKMLRHQLVCCAVWLALAASTWGQEEQLSASLERAKAALERKDGESASIELHNCEPVLEGISPKARRTTLRNQVTALLRRSDPRYVARAKALETAAKALVKAAKAYTAKQWHGTALPLLELAAKLAPQHAIEARDQARLLTPSATAEPASTSQSFFNQASEPYPYEDKWKLLDGEIHSPDHQEPQATMLRSGKPIEQREYFVEVEVRTAGEPGQVSLCISHRGLQSFVLLELFFLPAKAQNPLALSELRFLTMNDGPAVELSRSYPSLSRREHREWNKLRIEVRGTKLRGILGGFYAIEAEIKDQPLIGHFGLFIASSSDWRGVTRFRNLRYGPLVEGG